LEDVGLLFVASDKFVGGAERAFEGANLLDHVGPALGVHGKFVVGAFAVVAVGEVAFDDAGTEGDCANDGGGAVGVVGEAEDDVGEEGGVGFEDVEVEVVVIVIAGGVVGVALHEDDLVGGGEGDPHGTDHVAEVGRAGRDEEGFAKTGHFEQAVGPGHEVGTGFVGGDEGGEHGDGVVVVGAGEIVEAVFVAGFFEDGGPFKGDRGVLVDFKDGFFPRGLVGELATEGLEAVVGDDFGGAEVLEFGGVCPSLFGEADEFDGAVEVAVMVGGDVGDEVGGVVEGEGAVGDLEGGGGVHGEGLRYWVLEIGGGNL